MSRICRFTVLASRDLESILDYLAKKSSISSAESFLEKFNQKCQNLANFPSLGRSRDELFLGIRSLPIDQYLIFYRLQEDEIEIVRIVSGYQDLDALFEEE